MRFLWELLTAGKAVAPAPGIWTEGAPPLKPGRRCLFGWYEERATTARYPFLIDTNGEAWDVGRGIRIDAKSVLRHLIVPDPYA